MAGLRPGDPSSPRRGVAGRPAGAARVEFMADACDLQYDLGVKRRGLSVDEACGAIETGATVLARDAEALRAALSARGVAWARIDGLPKVRGAEITAIDPAR